MAWRRPGAASRGGHGAAATGDVVLARSIAADLAVQPVAARGGPDGETAQTEVLAIAIGCIGLYGLAAFDTTRRVKEIGIRKTLGASTADVLTLLIGQFMRPVILANIVAWPLAYVAMQRWLAGFDDRIALSPMVFLGASLAAVLIASATVLGQAWRVSRAEPARALRYE